MKITPSQFLRQAWSYIDTPQKWTKGATHRSGIHALSHCSVGALEEAAYWARCQGVSQGEQSGLFHAAVAALSKTIPEVEPGWNSGDIMRFNDLIATHEQLEQLWEKAAIKLEEVGQ